MLYTRSRECTSRGPTLTAAEFERLDFCPQNRLLIFESFGQDSHHLYSPLLAIPSDDISATTEQCTLFDTNRGKDKDHEFEGRVPLVAELIHARHNPTDYAISASGPFVFDRMSPWCELWSLLHACSSTKVFVHPRRSSHQRQPSSYQVTVRELHQVLADRHASIDIAPSSYDQALGDDDHHNDDDGRD